jgi:hypothetical protein
VTTAGPTAYVIIVDRAGPRQLEAVQVAIRDNSQWWWHNISNAWIVIDLKSHHEWSQIVASAIQATGVEAKLLVLKLPHAGGDRHFAAIGTDDVANDWLWGPYRGEPRPK